MKDLENEDSLLVVLRPDSHILDVINLEETGAVYAKKALSTGSFQTASIHSVSIQNLIRDILLHRLP